MFTDFKNLNIIGYFKIEDKLNIKEIFNLN